MVETKQYNEYIKQYKDKVLEQIKEYNPTFTNRDESEYGIGFADGRMSRDREIIRCRECKHYTKAHATHIFTIPAYCDIFAGEDMVGELKPDDFCSRGERR